MFFYINLTYTRISPSDTSEGASRLCWSAYEQQLAVLGKRPHLVVDDHLEVVDESPYLLYIREYLIMIGVGLRGFRLGTVRFIACQLHILCELADLGEILSDMPYHIYLGTGELLEFLSREYLLHLRDVLQ